MPTNKLYLSDIIKFIWATTILFGGFLFKAENIIEEESQQYFQDYLNTENDISIMINTGVINTWEYHQSAAIINYQDICKESSKICSKTDFIWDFLDQEKILYLQDIKKVTNFIDTNNVVSQSFTDKLKILEINKEGGVRWYATRDTVVLNVSNLEDPSEFSQLSTHEFGHIFDLWFLQWNTKQKNSNFTEFKKSVFANNDPSLLYYAISWKWESIRKAEAKQKQFCSSYGMSNPFEDFAECYNLYINHNAMFKNIAIKDQNLTKKYNFIATLLKWKYINKATTNLELLKDNQNRRPRDTTKLSIQ